MSVQAMNWAVTQRTGNAGAKGVLMALAFHATAAGECYPSQSLLASETELDARTVRRHLTTLETAGLIRKEHRQRRNGSRTSDRYCLNLAGVHAGNTPAVQPDTMPARPVQPDNLTARTESNRTLVQVQAGTMPYPTTFEQSLNSKDEQMQQQLDAVAEMLADLEAFEDSVPAGKWKAFKAQAALIASGEASGTWADPRTDGSQVPWPERPAMFRLALAHCVANEVWVKNPMHSALRYVLPQQLTPFPAPKSNRAPPGSQAAAVLDSGKELPQSKDERGSGFETVAGEKLRSQQERDNERVDAWSKANAERANLLMLDCVDEATEGAGGDRYKRKAIEATARLLFRQRVLEILTPKLAAS